MRRAVALLMLSLVLPVLAGCYREAGQGVQDSGVALNAPTFTPAIMPTDVIPTDVLPTDVLPTDVIPTDTIPTDTPLLPVETPTPDTGVAITVVPPTPTDLPLVIPTATPTLPGAGVVQPATLAFETPISGSMPITAVPATATPAAPTPSGLVTPTALALNPDATPEAGTDDGCVYVVQAGNTLFRIAVNNNITLAQLRAANPELRGDLIQPGQRLNIPGCGQGLDAAGNPLGTPAPDAAPTAGAAAGATPTGDVTLHTVARGETLFTIARRYGVTVQEIVNANALTNPNLLQPGQQLVIPQP